MAPTYSQSRRLVSFYGATTPLTTPFSKAGTLVEIDLRHYFLLQDAWFALHGLLQIVVCACLAHGGTHVCITEIYSVLTKHLVFHKTSCIWMHHIIRCIYFLSSQTRNLILVVLPVIYVPLLSHMHT